MIGKEYTLQNIDNNANGITYKGYTATNGEWCIIADDGTNQRVAYGPKGYSSAWANRIRFMYTQEAPKNLFISSEGATEGLVTVFDSGLHKLAPAVAGIPVKTGNNTLDDGNGDANITGNLSVSGNITGNVILADTGVTAGTYNNNNTQITPFTVDSKGRITSVGNLVTITPNWSSITSKPTTLSGYGITDTIPISITGASAGLVTVFDNSLQKLVPATAGLAVKTGKNTLDDGNGNATIGTINLSVGIGWGINEISSTSLYGVSFCNIIGNNGVVLTDNTSGSNAVFRTGNFGVGLTNTPLEAIDVNGNIQLSGALKCNLITTLTGTTAGSVQWSQYMQGQFKAFAAQFLGYENNSTTSQTIAFPTPFVNTPVIVTNTTGLTITVTTTTLTITSPNNTTLYSGIVKVEGF
jgi:hypothetical protein